MALATYSSRDVKITYGGATIDGLMPDDFVTIERNADVTSQEVGADSQTQISFLPDESATVTVSLQQNSKTNRKLSALLEAQRQNREVYQASMIIADPSGSMIARLKNVHISSYPTLTLGSDASGNGREWTFFAERLVYLSVPEGVADDAADAADVAAFVDTIVSNAQT